MARGTMWNSALADRRPPTFEVTSTQILLCSRGRDLFRESARVNKRGRSEPIQVRTDPGNRLLTKLLWQLVGAFLDS
jgi:hypothetical protein